MGSARSAIPAAAARRDLPDDTALSSDNLLRGKRLRYRHAEVDGTVTKWYSEAA